MVSNKYLVTNDRESLEQAVNICNENMHHYLILNYLRIHIISPTKNGFCYLDNGQRML